MCLPLLEHGAQRLDDIVKPGMLCAFDFDGTLAPIVKDPDHASIPAPVLRRLITLSELTPVAVISGRALDDMGLRLDFMPEFVIGNHGLEGVPDWEGRTMQYQAVCAAWEQQLADCAIIAPRVRVENKGSSLTVHYRMARNQAEVERHLTQLFATLSPAPQIVPGQCAFNLLPAEAPGKVAVLAHLRQVSDAPSVLYVGDDSADEKIFGLRRDDWLGVRIEGAGNSAAEFYLPHRLDMVQLLDMLIHRLDDVHRPVRDRNVDLHSNRTALHSGS